MPNPRQLALQIQINERASLNNFFVSKNNNKTIQVLKNILFSSDSGVQVFIDDLGSNGKSYLLQAICNDFSNSNNSSIYIPMKEAINLDTSILEGVSELNLIWKITTTSQIIYILGLIIFEIFNVDKNPMILHILIGFITLFSLISYFRWGLNNNFTKQNA